MRPTQTGIAVALALAVVAYIFFFSNAPLLNELTPGAQNTVPDTTNQNASTTMPTSAGELQMTDEAPGSGATAETGDTVTVNYVGALTDGTVFDASANHGTDGLTFVLGAGRVIKGWDQGIVGMQEGGRRLLVIPPSLGYGNQAVGNIIPPNATLVFEVELVKVQKAAQ